MYDDVVYFEVFTGIGSVGLTRGVCGLFICAHVYSKRSIGVCWFWLVLGGVVDAGSGVFAVGGCTGLCGV